MFCKGNNENVWTILVCGANINLTNKYDNSALYFATKDTDSEIIAYLINHNISVNIANDDKDKPLKWAYLAKGNIESVRTLLAHGEDIDWTNDCNKSALPYDMQITK